MREFIHVSAYAHTHIQAHSLMRALTLSCARTHARTRMTHTGARAQTRMHPGTRRPDYARTHAPAHEHACMRTHTRKYTRTYKHAHAHPRYAQARNHMQACARTTCMHAYARGICTHVPAQCSYMRTYAHERTCLHIRQQSWAYECRQALRYPSIQTPCQIRIFNPLKVYKCGVLRVCSKMDTLCITCQNVKMWDALSRFGPEI